MSTLNTNYLKHPSSTANNLTLNSDGSVSGGLPTGGRNALVNGSMAVWQRSTSAITITTSSYTADRWAAYRAVAGSSVSRQTTSDTTNLPTIKYCARVGRDSGNTATNAIYFGQPLETIDSLQFAGKTVTFSFWARAGANYSSASNALKVEIVTGTGTDQNVIHGSYTGSSTIVSSTKTLTTTWQKFSVSAAVASTATEIAAQVWYTPVGTAGAADYFEITGVQLEEGPVATPFEFEDYGTTLRKCQRYYQVFINGNTQMVGIGFQWNASASNANAYFIPMRTTPTLSATSGTNYYYIGNSASGAYGTTLTVGVFSPNAMEVDFNTSWTINNVGVMRSSSASAFAALQAEL